MKVPIVVAIISQKGGVGKSTLARALGALSTAAGLHVMLADLDPLQRTVVLWNEARKQNNIEPVLAVNAFAQAEEAHTAARGADLLILDTPGQVNDDTMDVARRADLIIQPTGPSFDDLHPSVLLFRALVNLGVSQQRLVMAIARYLSAGEEERARAFLTDAGYAVLPGGIPEGTIYREAHNRGLALTEIDTRRDEDALTLMADLFLRVRGLLDAPRMN